MSFAMQFITVPRDLDVWAIEWDLENTVSPTTHNTFQHCPFQWRCKDLGFPKVTMDTQYMDFGNSVHGQIAAYYKSLSGEGWLTPEGIKERLEAFVYTIEKRPRGKNMKKIVEEMLRFEQWRQKRYPDDPMIPIAIEQYFKTPPFHGYIDFIAHDFVLDWKTGKGQVSEDYIRQVNSYFYASMKLGHEPKKGYLGFVETGMKPMIPINLEKLLKEVWAFFQLTSDPNFHYPRNRGYKCRWCSWRTICERGTKYSHEFLASRLIAKRAQRLAEANII